MYSDKTYYLVNIEKKQETIRNMAAHYRRAADKIIAVKPIVQEFDGKIVNCRFDEALKMHGDNWRIYASHRFKRYEITYIENQNYNDEIILMSGFDCKADNKPRDDGHLDDDLLIFDSKKHIQANKIFALLNNKRAELLKTATDYERFADELPTIMKRVQDAANLMDMVLNAVPYHLRGVSGVERIRT